MTCYVGCETVVTTTTSTTSTTIAGTSTTVAGSSTSTTGTPMATVIEVRPGEAPIEAARHELPFTGGDVVGLSAMGVAAIGVGAILTRWRKRA